MSRRMHTSTPTSVISPWLLSRRHCLHSCTERNSSVSWVSLGPFITGISPTSTSCGSAERNRQVMEETAFLRFSLIFHAMIGMFNQRMALPFRFLRNMWRAAKTVHLGQNKHFEITTWSYSSASSKQFVLYLKALAILVPEI